jgi:acetyl-CoA C-acetyltransferase
MKNDPARIPVIVGVGEVNDRPREHEDGLDPTHLMAEALDRADADAGGSWRERCDRLFVVPQISFRGLDVPPALAHLTGLAEERITQAPMASGDTPVRLLHDAANMIASGEAQICAVTGGEALRTATRRAAKAGTDGSLFSASAVGAPPLRHRYGLITPSEIYPLYENALRAELGQTLAEAQAETGLIWSLMSEVAAESSGAWLRTPRSACEIVEPTTDNRPIAFPYTKFMVANASVNQGAAAIVTSLANARDAGIAEERLVHVGAGAAAHEPEEPLARVGWTISPSMRVSIERTMQLNGLVVDDLDMVELYSCFPCVPKMARRVLGWPADRPVSVHGGLTFGGGPIGNYMGHAIAAMVRRLRAGGRHGLLFANGGHCSHNHSLLLSRVPPAPDLRARDYHFQHQADALRGPVPTLTDTIEGILPVETYTVVYRRDGEPSYGVVLSQGSAGERVIARVESHDTRSIAYLTSGAIQPVGKAGINRRVGDVLVWSAP